MSSNGEVCTKKKKRKEGRELYLITGRRRVSGFYREHAM